MAATTCCGRFSAGMCSAPSSPFAACGYRLRSGQGDGLSGARLDAVRGGGSARRSCGPNIEWRGVPFFTGVVTTIIQILAGVGGSFSTSFSRRAGSIARPPTPPRRSTQSFSHIVRALYFGSLSGVGDLPVWATVPAIVLAIAGTSLAPFVIERMTDHGFRQWTRGDHLRHQCRLSRPRRLADLALASARVGKIACSALKGSPSFRAIPGRARGQVLPTRRQADVPGPVGKGARKFERVDRTG